jgi:DNA-binding transcriptional LysR family regulator
MNKLQAMEAFVAVVDHQGFNAASEELPISRAAVSKAVSELEASLGGRLLNRTTRRISLTEAGSAYYGRCREILQAVIEADCTVTGLSATPRGTLRINAPMSFGHRQLGPLVAAFRQRYPDIRLELVLADRMVDMVEEGFDVTIRITRPRDSSLVARRVAPCRFAVVASRDYLAEFGRPEIPAELATHRCLVYHYAAEPETWRFRRGGQTDEVRVGGDLCANNGDMLCAAAAAGAGVALLPTFVISDAIRAGRLVTLLDDYTVPSVGIYAVYPSARFLSAKVRLWVDLLVETLGDNPFWDHAH